MLSQALLSQLDIPDTSKSESKRTNSSVISRLDRCNHENSTVTPRNTTVIPRLDRGIQATVLKTILPACVLLFVLSLLSGCSNWFQDEVPSFARPTKLTAIKETIHPEKLWIVDIGGQSENLAQKQAPVFTQEAVIATNRRGRVTAIDRDSGRTLWNENIGIAITTGPTVADGNVYVGTRDGQIVCLDLNTGEAKWRALVSDQVLAPPAVWNNRVFVKAIDGKVTALNATTGQPLWIHTHIEPELILRGGVTPVPAKHHNIVLVGYADGKLTALRADNGQLVWSTPISMPHGIFSMQRLVDVDVTPIIEGNHIYAASYQGNLAEMGLQTGRKFWQHKLSSYTGLASAKNGLFVTDDAGTLWAFAKDTGKVLWKQTHLANRDLTAPAIQQGVIVVGDEQGYIHWLSRRDGHFVAREQVNQSAIVAKPVVDGKDVVALTQNGEMVAYRLSS